MVRRVERPAVDYEARSWTTDALDDDARVAGKRYHYGRETGEQAFDILVGDGVCGLLVEGRRRALALTEDGQRHEVRVWHLREATGPLATFTGRVWEDHGRPGDPLSGIVLADIRAALEVAVTMA